MYLHILVIVMLWVYFLVSLSIIRCLEYSSVWLLGGILKNRQKHEVF